jgi:hypothetical protein
LWKKSSVKTILLMTKTRVFAIFEKMVIGLNSQDRLFQGRREAQQRYEEMKMT